MIFESIRSMLNIQVILVFIVVLFTSIWYLKRRRLSGLPPGPPCLPVIGSLPWIGLKRTAAFPKLREKYGDVFTIYVFSRPVVVLASYETIKEALVDNADVFSDRPNVFLTREIAKNRGVLFTNGQQWKDSRRFCLRTLRDFGIGKLSLEGKVMDEVNTCIEEFLKQNNQPFDPQFIIGRCVSNIICSIIFGQRFEYNDPVFLQFLENLNRNLRNVEKVQLVEFFPFLRYIPGDPVGYKDSISSVSFQANFINEHIRQHQESFDPDQIRDFIDAYLKEESEAGKDESGMFVEGQLRLLISNLFAAGSETTATTLRWGLLFLMENEDVQTRVQNEIDKVIGASRPPSVTDRANMPYTEATIMEIQRCADLIPGDLPHAVSKDFTFRGFHIPAGTMIIPYLTSALQDKVFKTVNKFDPGNFLDHSHKVTKPEQFIPFSTGRRVCLGESLAKMELFLFLTALLQRFTFKPEEGKPVPKSERYEGIVVSPVPFKCRALERI